MSAQTLAMAPACVPNTTVSRPGNRVLLMSDNPVTILVLAIVMAQALPSAAVTLVASQAPTKPFRVLVDASRMVASGGFPSGRLTSIQRRITRAKPWPTPCAPKVGK